jgi:putative transcriptional regulator
VASVKASEFRKLLQGVREAGEYLRGERLPARVTEVGGPTIRELRKSLHLTQAQFARLLTVELSTRRNREQGRREPQGPAKALLRAIKKDPRNVLRALSGA